MDGDRFDDLTRSLAGDASRRELLRLLAGVLGGGPLAMGGPLPVDSRDKKAGDKGGKLERDAKRNRPNRPKGSDRDERDDRGSVSGKGAAAGRRVDCDGLCDVISKAFPRSDRGAARSICRMACNPSHPVVAVAVSVISELVEHDLANLETALQVAKLLVKRSLLTLSEAAEAIADLVKAGVIALCNGDVSRLCIASPTQITCCKGEFRCSDGRCQCPRGTVRCDGACLPRCPGAHEERDPQTCRCRCVVGAQRCGGRCVLCDEGQVVSPEGCRCLCPDGSRPCRAVDPAERCPGPCPEGSNRVGSNCQCTCLPGRKRCDGTCVATDTDPDHCGGCNASCKDTACEHASCEGGTCNRTAIANCCTDDAGCDDGDPCTRDTCDPASNRCRHEPIDGCCASDGQCGDDNACTEDICDQETHRCRNRPIEGCCTRDEQCATQNPCTRDTCDQATNTCRHDAIVDCCRRDEECDDGDPCTDDTCGLATNTCQHAPVLGCCRADGDCAACRRCSFEHRCEADRGQDGGICRADGGDGACCDGACVTCDTGTTLDLATCSCIGGGDGCVCTRMGDGEGCAADADCCSGRCYRDEAGVGHCGSSDLGEVGCAPDPAFCSNDANGNNHCCSGLCEGCECVCRAVGDATCRADRECCGRSICAERGCCLEPGEDCGGDESACCSGVCEALYADVGYHERYCVCGGVGTPCRNGNQCCSQVCDPDTNTCACSRPEHSNLACRYDGDCCDGRCVNGIFNGTNGQDGLCCRFAGAYCRFGYECCSDRCDAETNRCE